MAQQIYILIYPGFELLDMSGPTAVFSAANALLGRAHYRITVVSKDGGPISSHAGISVETQAITEVRFTSDDTLLTVGCEWEHLQRVLECGQTMDWLRAANQTVARMGSICLGSYLFAHAGLLDGRRAATHWAACRQFAQSYPLLTVDDEALYVRDGKLWTSAGVSTGLDMALAMLADDLGAALKGKVARRLVVFSHRPGHQSQFSSLLDAQVSGGDDFADLILWLEDHLDQPHRVGELAERVGMSERNFYRRFTDKMGLTPSKFIEKLRLDRAKQLLEAGQAVKQVCAEVGFRSEAGFRTAFNNSYGITPSLHQKLNGP